MVIEYRMAGLLIAVIIGAFSSTPAAQAITSDTFIYSPVKTGYYSIDPLDFAPLNGLAGDNVSIQLAPIRLTTGGGCYGAGVNLPHGVKVTTVVFWYSTTGDVDVRLFRNKLTDGSSALLVDKVISDNTGTRKANTTNVSPSLATIGNFSYSYGLDVCMSSGDAFYGARITYTYQNAGD